ncbi:hypothetical protein ARMGADRAFT_1037955 [Armillaria gallica]|uniref:Uncharacterized protein n=1 Tax=Armillaria gallica TaxID=47427 RepID=A0A2H3CJS7_ARMGA|nr:hypothetical protein ARMGADRAFT_1037955 [Armillaria gallica]
MASSIGYTLSQFPEPSPLNETSKLGCKGIYNSYAMPPETVATVTSDVNSMNSTTPTASRGTTPLPPASDTSVPSTSNSSVPLDHPTSSTMEMLQALLANHTLPPEVLAHFHNILRSTLHRALLYTVPPTAGVHQDRVKALAELYSIMAGLGTSLTFLFALSENIRAKEVQSMERKKMQMKEMDKCHIITQKNILDVLGRLL